MCKVVAPALCVCLCFQGSDPDAPTPTAGGDRGDDRECLHHQRHLHPLHPTTPKLLLHCVCVCVSRALTPMPQPPLQVETVATIESVFITKDTSTPYTQRLVAAIHPVLAQLPRCPSCQYGRRGCLCTVVALALCVCLCFQGSDPDAPTPNCRWRQWPPSRVSSSSRTSRQRALG